MPGDKSRPSTPSWKKAAPSAERKREAQPGWRRDSAPDFKASGAWSRQSKIAAGAAAFLVFNALLIGILLLLAPPKPSYLVLLGADYADNLAVPHNVYGRQGLGDLAEISRWKTNSFLSWGAGLFNLKSEPQVLKEGDDWAKGLADAKEKTVIVFLALHGGADSDSKGPYLLREGDGFGQVNRWRVAEVLDKLAALPANKNKVLILDATQVPAEWSLGLLHNDFARALEKLLNDRPKDPNLFVLSASGADQRSWVSEEWRQSVFAHFVIEGLKGAADESAYGARNSRVSLLELANYVEQEVKTWAGEKRNALQTPVLYGDVKKAADIDLVQVKEPYQGPAAAEGTPELAAQELEAEWDKFQELQQQVPAPFVYAPQHWRLYTDTLLRYEQLVRAGADDKARNLKKSLEDYERVIQEARRLELRSFAASTAMPVALGLTGPGAEKLDGYGKELWEADREAKKKWEQILQKEADDPSNTGGQVLRSQLCGRILQRAADTPRDGLARARRLLDVLGVRDPRPAEAHFLAMLARDLDLPQHPELGLIVQEALRLRRLAELVALAVPFDDNSAALPVKYDEYPYSAQVFSWISATVEKADQSRRLGEDYLFATGQTAWDTARKHLQEADEQYRKAKQDADKVRAALQTRDEVLAKLPYYSQWMARQGGGGDKEWTALVELWKDVHALAGLLAERDAGADRDGRLKKLEVKAQDVKKAFGQIRDRFKLACSQLSKSDQEGLWRAADNALAVPWMESPRARLDLLRRARDISRQLHEARSGKVSGPTKEENAELVKAAAQRQGRLALAVLGQETFEALAAGPKAEQVGFADVRPWVGLSPTDPDGRASFARAADAIGARWRQLPEQIAEAARKSRKEEKLGPAKDFMGSAERFARQLDGAGAQHLWRREQALNPANDSRRLLTHDLLLWLAERTYRDHWFAENDTDEPYYCLTGRRLVQDAKRVLPGNTDDLNSALRQERLSAATRVDTKFHPERLEAVGPERLDVTSEPALPVSYSLQPEPKDKPWAPEGHPVLWLEPGNELGVTGSQGNTERVALGINEKQPFEIVPKKPAEEPREPETYKTSLTLRGRFRGQKIEKRADVFLHRMPDVVWYKVAAPEKAAVNVQAPDEVHRQFALHRGAITIVLDCSGSMLTSRFIKNVGGKKYKYKDDDTVLDSDGLFAAVKADWKKDFPCNYHEATSALRQVLRGIPKETPVSLFMFSHYDLEANKVMDIQRVRRAGPWDPAETDELMDQVEGRYMPWTETPLARAMWQAKKDGFPPDFKGHKTMIVLTDGEDSQFANDQELNPDGKKAIGSFLDEQFRGRGIAINLVGFKVAAGEEENLTKQFKEAIQKLGGKFYTVKGSKDLVRKLKRDLEPRLSFQVYDAVRGNRIYDSARGDRGQTDLDEGEWPVGGEGRLYRPALLPPGSYRVQVRNGLLKQEISLARGDYLLLSIAPDGSGFRRVRPGETEAGLPSAPDKKDNRSWLTVAKNKRDRDGGSLEMLAFLENAQDRPTDIVQQVRPQMAWFDLQAPDGERPVAVRWWETYGYAAPAYELRVPRWPNRSGSPEAAKPQVTAWWNADHAPLSQDLPPREGKTLEQAFANREVQFRDAAAGLVKVESVRLEEQAIPEPDPAPNQPPKKALCLVARLIHPPGKRVWVEVDGQLVDRAEHRYYSAANKYTGIFWVRAPKDDPTGLKLRIFAVDQFRLDPETKRVELPLKATAQDNPFVKIDLSGRDGERP